MGYKWIAVLLIGFNTLLLIILIAVGLRYERSDKTAQVQTESPETEQTDDTSVPMASVGDEVYEEDNKEESGRESEYLLLLTSADSDLQIRIVDREGAPAEGKEWKAVLQPENGEAETCTDDDRDGMIYLRDAHKGRYDVHVDGVGDASITIRDTIRMRAVTDIRRIIAQESSVDAEKEDTQFREEAAAETEELPEGSYELSGGAVGIDVSKYNKNIDWQQVRNSGIEYAIIRAGYRGSSTGVLVEDPFFRQNLAGARMAGLKIGVYFFTQALNPEEAAEEACAVASLVNSSDLQLPVFLDVESSGSANGRADGLDIAVRSENIRVFCETLENMGYQAGVYASKSWLTGKIDTSLLGPYDIWLAQYRMRKPDYNGRYSIWQYTSKGHVDGIEGNVDLDLFINREE